MPKRQPDYPLIAITFILVVLGLVALSSASVVVSNDFFNKSYHFLIHQLMYSLPVGLLVFFILQKYSYKKLKSFSFPLIILSIVLLVLVFVPGLSYGNQGVKRWVALGSFSFQPFEFAKLAFIVYLAALLGKRPVKESLIPALVAFSVISLLVIAQPNMSALIILTVIAFAIYFLAEAKFSYLLTIGVGIMIAGFILAQLAPYRMARLTVFLNPELDPQGIGYQTNQALLAIGSGGVFGLGLGHSVQKWKYLPEVIGDSIFAITAEELGLAGAGTIVILFMLLAWRGIKIAKNAPDKFGYLLAGGITSWIFFQAFINMGSISGIIPMTGIPLPFISYGGSSLITVLAGIGILVNISKS